MRNAADKNQGIHTIPEGIWEGSRPAGKEEGNKCTVTTDLQGNGYPTEKKEQHRK